MVLIGQLVQFGGNEIVAKKSNQAIKQKYIFVVSGYRIFVIQWHFIRVSL